MYISTLVYVYKTEWSMDLRARREEKGYSGESRG
jgi:hypothetical protein